MNKTKAITQQAGYRQSRASVSDLLAQPHFTTCNFLDGVMCELNETTES